MVISERKAGRTLALFRASCLLPSERRPLLEHSISGDINR